MGVGRNLLGGLLVGAGNALEVAAKSGYEDKKNAVIAANLKAAQEREDMRDARNFEQQRTMLDLHNEYNTKATQQQHEWAGQADDKNYQQQIMIKTEGSFMLLHKV
jgi:hypothetical protein